YIGMKVGTDLVEASGQGITSNLASVKWNQTLDNITPVIISATPNTGAPGKTIPYNITGLNFNGSIVSLTRSGQKDLIGNNTVTSSTMLLGNLTIRPDAPIGAWSWQVTNQNGKKSNQINFTVNSGPWEITSVSPSFACRGSTFPFTITGKIFDNPKKVILSKEYCGVPLTSDVKTWTSTSITGSFSIPASACVGDWYFYVTDNSGTNRCQINYPIKDCSTKPSVSAIYPVEGARNKLIPFLITGSGFLSGNMTVQLTKTGSSSISATNLTIDTTSQQIFGSFLIPKTAKTGSYRVSVNAGSLYSTQKVYFTVF
ncbi:MAG TPA: hypothetical protein VN372_07355, partial [Methanospirillum sp.]|nr:hypothetical protein [Methanospirillum sp.]